MDLSHISNLISSVYAIASAPLALLIYKKASGYSKHRKDLRDNEARRKREEEERKKNHDKEVIDKLHETDDTLKAALIAILHHEIYYNCTHYINNGYITTGQKDDLEYLFRSYHGMGGNSTGEWLYNRACKLSVKDDID